MADAPTPIASSALPATFQAAEIAKQRDAVKVGESQAAARQVRTLDEADGSVETTDAGVQVFADAEGTGSQGRSSEEQLEESPSSQDAPQDSQGLTQDQDGTWHLDMEA